MASKSKSRRRVLRASCILAALIIAGSSFAWFTSSDEVTNRLSASANYGVSIVEDFTPPKVMVPGQEVDKDVAVVNTGSIDAFARVHLINDLQVSRVKYTNAFDGTDANNKATKAVTATVYYLDKTDGKVKTETYDNSAMATATNNPLTAYNTKRATDKDSATKEYLYATYNFAPSVDTTNLSSAITDSTNSNNNAVDLSDREVRNGVELTANEVSTLQAGGKLVVKASVAIAPADVRAGDDNEYVYIAQTAANRPVMKDSSDRLWIVDGGEYYAVTESTDATTAAKSYSAATTRTDTSTLTPAISGLTYVSSQIPLKDFSGSTQFLPDTTGFYLFERTENKDKDVTGSVAPEYSGYYYVASGNPGDGKYYALKTKVDPATGTTDVTKNKLTTTVYTDATVTKDAKGVINEITGLQLKTKTAMADYTKYFTAAGSKDDNGYYPSTSDATNPEITYTWYNGDTELAAGDDKKTATKIKVDYTFGTTDTTDDVVFFINLDENWSDNWTYVAESNQTGANAINDKTNAIGYFYYNKLLDSGKTSEKLITSVTLDSATTPFAYSDLIYDLGVKLDSIQVTYDTNNKETVDAAKEAWHTNAKDVNVAVSTYETADTNNINEITWSDYS